MLCILYNRGKKGGDIMGATFGAYLRKLRLEKNVGLRAFAKATCILPSNLCHLESGRQNPPQEWAKKAAKALGLKEDSPQWEKFFDLAAKPGEFAVDVKDYLSEAEIAEELPVMARTIKNRKLTREDIEKLIEDIKKL